MNKLVKSLSGRMPVVKKHLVKFMELVSSTGQGVMRGQQELFIQQLLQSPRYADKSHLAHFEHQVYSQNGEDGIITEIFRRIGINNKTFIEIGVGDGLENNSAFLLAQGWTGLWLEGSAKNAKTIRCRMATPIAGGKLKFTQAFVTAENVAALVQSAGADIDLLSIDIDLNTYHAWKALADLKARVVVVEYNAAMPPWLEWQVDHQAEKWYDGTFYFGASLKSFELLGKAHGYSLVGCDLHGVNAFFVRNDLLNGLFTPPFTAEACYEPPRYWLIRTVGHPRSFDGLNRRSVSS